MTSVLVNYPRKEKNAIPPLRRKQKSCGPIDPQLSYPYSLYISLPNYKLKVGSVARSERAAKWNEAIRMEEYLGESGYYPSKDIFKRVIK